MNGTDEQLYDLFLKERSEEVLLVLVKRHAEGLALFLNGFVHDMNTAQELALDEKTWAEKSMLIRRSHECTHFFTKQRYGISNNILHDELMADFIGLYDAFGFYKAEWFLKFMGIIKGNGNRMIVYTKNLSPKVKEAVTVLIREAAYQLEKWSETEQFLNMTNPERIRLLCQAGISQIISGI